MNDQQKDEKLELIKNAATRLSEHFDTVHIFCAKDDKLESDGTIHFSWGLGNWFARYGQIRQWLIKEDQVARESVKE